MNEEELEKEARINLKRRFGEFFPQLTISYVMGAEPREKRIEELEEKNKSLTEQVCNVANNLLDNWCRNEEDYCPHLAKLEQENAELKEKVSFLKDNLRVARKDREDLQLNVAKGLKEFVHDYPATALRFLANEKYVEQLTKAKEIIKYLCGMVRELNKPNVQLTNVDYSLSEAEQFLKDSEVEK